MNDCIFCKIAKKQVPAKIVHEDEKSVAFLDINPRSKGMCIVVPKEHFSTFDQNFDASSELFDVALMVAEKVKKSLSPITVFISMLQGQVPHFHLRVYPVYEDQIPLVENKPLKVSEGELNEFAEKIRNEEVEWKGREAVEEEEEPKEIKEEAPKKKRSEEEERYMRRPMKLG